MPYRVRWEGHGVYRRFYGTVSAQDVRNACDEIASDPRYDDIRYVLSDFLEASPALSEHEARALAQLERVRFFDNPDVVNAVIATNPRLFGCIPYLETADRSPCPIATFSAVSDARNWIAANPRLQWFRGPHHRPRSPSLEHS
jgi:hypothetical protein